MAALYYESQLCHHGIKGQRWGIRRFQNRDGSLTYAGSRRLNRAKRVEARRQQKQRDRLEIQKAKNVERLKTAELEKKISEQEEELHNLRKSTAESNAAVSKPERKKNVSEMSDAELHEVITRLRLERDYVDLITPKEKPVPDRLGKRLGVALTNAAVDGISGGVKAVIKSSIKSAFGVKDEKKKKKKKKDDDDDDD